MAKSFYASIINDSEFEDTSSEETWTSNKLVDVSVFNFSIFMRFPSEQIFIIFVEILDDSDLLQ